MAQVGEQITVSRVLDARPRIFSLPVAIIVPVMFILTVVGCLGYIAKLSGYMTLLMIVVSITVYFFLFGQESWRLAAKFRKPPNWVRSDIQAIPFTLDRNDEKTISKRKHQRSARKAV